jgi:hypothetical protein
MKNIIILIAIMSSTSVFSKDVFCEYHRKMIEFKDISTKTVDKVIKDGAKSLNFHIENVDKFSEANDYVEIKEKGRSLTYVLSCKNIDK